MAACEDAIPVSSVEMLRARDTVLRALPSLQGDETSVEYPVKLIRQARVYESEVGPCNYSARQGGIQDPYPVSSETFSGAGL